MFELAQRCRAITAAGLLALTAPATASLSTYSEDFEGLDPGSLTAIGDAGWEVFGSVFDPGGVMLYDYGPFPAPNNPDAPAFSLLATDQGGPDQGNVQMAVFSDYNNTDHANGNLIVASVFQTQTIGADDLGTIWRLQYDAKQSPDPFGVGGASIAAAFIQVLDSVNGTFFQLAFPTLDMTDASDLWMTYQLGLLIDPTWEGQTLQFGFLTVASNYEPSGIIYDNVRFGRVPLPPAALLLASGLVGLAGLGRRSG